MTFEARRTMYGGNYKPDHGALDYVAMGFGMVLFLGGWLWLGGMPVTTAQMWFRLAVLGIGAGGLGTCLFLKKRWE
jgi:hypothetical protein